MTWEERILNSDAGKGSREVAERMVREGRERPPVTVKVLGDVHLGDFIEPVSVEHFADGSVKWTEE